MPKHSETGNVRKICSCGRARWGSCKHPWYTDYKAPKDHPRRAGERYRKNLDQITGRHAASLAEAKVEAHRAILAWLDGRQAADLLPTDRPTLARMIAEYRERPNASTGEAQQIGPLTNAIVLGRRFGEWAVADITREVVEAFKAGRPRTAGNRNLAVLRAMFNWAVGKGLVTSTPFKVGHVTVVKLATEEARTRRLQVGEEEKLIAAARGLAPVIVAALETGCRRGELLSLQWHQVRFTPRTEIFLPAQKTKAKKDRRIPISSALRTVLEARRMDPAGELLPPEAYVFGDEVGRRRKTIKTAWGGTLRRAGITDLHFHDLRREAGSRWMDAGVPLATIQRWLGHHNISQTSTYLAASLGNDADDMVRFEERIGRKVAESTLTQIAISAGSDGRVDTRPCTLLDETTSKDAVVH